MTDCILPIAAMSVVVFFAIGIFIAKSCERIKYLERHVRDLYRENGELKRGLLGLWKEIKQKQGKRKKHKHHHDDRKCE